MVQAGVVGTAVQALDGCRDRNVDVEVVEAVDDRGILGFCVHGVT